MLLQKIESCTAHAGVIGLGYVGLSLAVAIANAGFKVTGIDISSEKIERIQQGISDIPDVTDSVLEALISSGQIQVTTEFNLLSQLDTVNICVPTPLKENKTPDLQYITAAVKEIAKHLHPEQLIILESTTYPGTTEEIVLPLLQSYPDCSISYVDTSSNLSNDNSNSKNKFQVGKDFYLAYSPERIEPGNNTYSMANTPKIVAGVTPKCTHIAKTFFEQFINKTHIVTSTKIAEMAKLLENTFRSVNIGLINEIALICDRMHLDVWETIDAAATKPFGFMPFYPGPGLGGHCIPVDPHFLSWKAQTYEYEAQFIGLASEINSKMPEYVLEKIGQALHIHNKNIKKSHILIIGVAYKKDIGDTRESPAFDVIRLILDKGASFLYHDPYVQQIILGEGEIYNTHQLTPAVVESVDCVVILTDHSPIDYEMIVDRAKIVVDTRNATHSIQNQSSKIIKI